MTVFSLSLLRRAFVLAGLLLATTLTSQAQAPGNGGNTGGPPAPQAPAAVPLDGGASLLLAGGIGLALRKLRQRRK